MHTEKQYYYVDQKRQRQGPFPLSQLPQGAITPDTLVWCPGMEQWQPAAQVPDMAPILAAAQQHAKLQPQPQQAGGTTPTPSNGGKSFTPVVILVSVLCFLVSVVIGIGALTYVYLHNQTDDQSGESSQTSDTIVVEESYDYIEDHDTLAVLVEEEEVVPAPAITKHELSGYVTRDGVEYPITLTFTEDQDGNITSCVYKNIRYDVTDQMEGYCNGNEYVFYGKKISGFEISITRDPYVNRWEGDFILGNSTLPVVLRDYGS